ncbi:MAG: hypothetical protein IT423_12775 [Pirellulaceae bacterium]|nr:hypothetical protein [Pirellulaceae bacterium]
MRAVMSACYLALLVGAVSGCQSWSQIGQGIPAGSRVAPPGTGSYPVPSSYYNTPKAGGVPSSPGSAAVGASSSAVPAGGAAQRSAAMPANPTGSGVTTAAWQPPTVDQLRTGVNQSASAVINNATTRANQVVQAGTSRAAAAIEQYTDAAPEVPVVDNNPPSLSASRSLSDSPPVEPPQLNWQAPPR